MFMLSQEIPKRFDENLKKLFFNTNKFYNHKINNFILLLQKALYPFEYIDDWEKHLIK